MHYRNYRGTITKHAHLLSPSPTGLRPTMFKLFRLRRSQELSPASHVMTGCRTPHADQDNHGSTPLWLQRGNYTFTMTSDMAVPVALHTPQEPDCFDRATHGRPAEILDDDNVAWNTPPTRNQ